MPEVGPIEGGYDLIGVGFGPANLALAVAVDEHAEDHGGHRLRTAFIERKERFAWHPGMLLKEATMQVSFLKDLATLRKPRSAYGFLSYLHEKGRLVDFVNRKGFFPSRVEFHDYLEWAAARFEDVVRYGMEVRSATPVLEGQDVVAFDVVACDIATGRTSVLRTKNLVVASGLVPKLPAGVERSARIWHSSQLLDRLGERSGGDVKSFAVIGAGQSAAEVTAHLHDRFPDADVYAVLSRYGYSPADDSPFANRVFDPAAVDHFFGAPPAVKEKFYRDHANTNYSVVDLELIDELYRRVYQESVRGERRLRILNMSQFTDLAEDDDGVGLRVEFLPDGRHSDLRVDVVVFATGYTPMDPVAAIGPVAELCKRSSSGLLRVGRDYRVETADGVSAGIYLQGGTEHTHGITASLLSNVSVRAWDIVESISARDQMSTAD
ncbi:lysine N(6)-hydroxylase/L-ornithine N(5)-oxygenase family protein [Amycolatopsis sp. NPDC058340]|uniref:lysine N(6)-hydroxylase/L-ornithine N(5)-oxygenase family protein n=1 Tax=Amycolatopsis sp. NPDC058340 TaxID=3346453 RepID=UPI0036586458